LEHLTEKVDSGIFVKAVVAIRLGFKNNTKLFIEVLDKHEIALLLFL
jgi:hypothetical protein